MENLFQQHTQLPRFGQIKSFHKINLDAQCIFNFEISQDQQWIAYNGKCLEHQLKNTLIVMKKVNDQFQTIIHVHSDDNVHQIDFSHTSQYLLIAYPLKSINLQTHQILFEMPPIISCYNNFAIVNNNRFVQIQIDENFNQNKWLIRNIINLELLQKVSAPDYLNSDYICGLSYCFQSQEIQITSYIGDDDESYAMYRFHMKNLKKLLSIQYFTRSYLSLEDQFIETKYFYALNSDTIYDKYQDGNPQAYRVISKWNLKQIRKYTINNKQTNQLFQINKNLLIFTRNDNNQQQSQLVDLLNFEILEFPFFDKITKIVQSNNGKIFPNKHIFNYIPYGINLLQFE